MTCPTCQPNRIEKLIYCLVRGLQLVAALHGLRFLAAVLLWEDRPWPLLGLVGFAWLMGERLAGIGVEAVKHYSRPGTVVFVRFAVFFAAIPIEVFWLT